MIAEIVFWWYGTGWRVFLQKIRNIFSRTADFFSMSSLARTLFKPFRQISAESAKQNVSLDLKFQMFLDRFVSRFIGFFSRLFLLIIGAITIIISGVFSCIILLLWPLLPLLPIAGIVLTVLGITL